MYGSLGAANSSSSSAVCVRRRVAELVQTGSVDGGGADGAEELPGATAEGSQLAGQVSSSRWVSLIL